MLLVRWGGAGHNSHFYINGLSLLVSVFYVSEFSEISYFCYLADDANTIDDKCPPFANDVITVYY